MPQYKILKNGDTVHTTDNKLNATLAFDQVYNDASKGDCIECLEGDTLLRKTTHPGTATIL